MAGKDDKDKPDKEQVDLGAFCNESIKVARALVKESQQLPAQNSSEWDYYTSFPDFLQTLQVESNTILSSVAELMQQHNPSQTDIRVPYADSDKYDLLKDFSTNIFDETIELLNAAEDAVIHRKEAAMPGAGDDSAKGHPSTTPTRRSHGPITKPQLYFEKKPNNDASEDFRPVLTRKPHHVTSLEDSIVSIEINGRFGFKHPYETELNLWEPKKRDLTASPPKEEELKKLHVPLEEVQFEFIDKPEQLPGLVEELSKHTIIGFDLEHHSYRSFQGFTCLLQLSVQGKDYVVDAMKLREKLEVLNEVFTNPTILKIGHGTKSDIIWLQRDLGVYVVNLFDTYEASFILEFPRKSLAALLDTVCGVKVDKQHQLADWRIRPLDDELIEYARKDTRYLEYLFWQLRQRLLDAGNNSANLFRQTLERSRDICLSVYSKPEVLGRAFQNLEYKCRQMYDLRQMAALKELYLWRDAVARSEDESPHYVCPTHMLQKMAEALPREMQAIPLCCNPTPPLVKANLLTIHQIILRARQLPLDRTSRNGSTGAEPATTFPATQTKPRVLRTGPVPFNPSKLFANGGDGLHLENHMFLAADDSGRLKVNTDFKRFGERASKTIETAVVQTECSEALKARRGQLEERIQSLPEIMTPYERYLGILPLTRGDLAKDDEPITDKIAKLRDRLKEINDATDAEERLLAPEAVKKEKTGVEPTRVADLSRIYGPGGKEFDDAAHPNARKTAPMTGGSALKSELMEMPPIKAEPEEDKETVMRDEMGGKKARRRAKKRPHAASSSDQASAIEDGAEREEGEVGDDEPSSNQSDDYSVFDAHSSKKRHGDRRGDQTTEDGQPVHHFRAPKQESNRGKRSLPWNRRHQTYTYTDKKKK